ncbi:RTA1 like protein-domain-containing protein [Trichoderma sp. SZMC 28011]
MDTETQLLVGALIVRETSPSVEEFKLYHYNPTIGGAVVFVLLFLGTTSFHLYQTFRTRCWFVTPLIVGGICYAARCASGKESPNWTLGPYITQSLLLLVAPALFAATIYMELGRVISLVDGESHCLIRKQWLTKVFVFGDVLSFFLQGGGGGYQASGTASALETGSHIIIVGLFVQLVFFGFFMVIAVEFHLSIRRAPTIRLSNSNELPWQKHMNTLYIASALIMVRSLFRVVEYLQGFNGYLLHHEAYLYIFDGLLMFLVMVLLNVVHPSELAASMKHKTATDYEVNLRAFAERHQRLGSEMT